eukprot:3510618-Prymnesium_polylepis.1
MCAWSSQPSSACFSKCVLPRLRRVGVSDMTNPPPVSRSQVQFPRRALIRYSLHGWRAVCCRRRPVYRARIWATIEAGP